MRRVIERPAERGRLVRREIWQAQLATFAPRAHGSFGGAGSFLVQPPVTSEIEGLRGKREAGAARLDDVERSQGRYSAGVDVRLFDWLTLDNDFLGRSEVGAATGVAKPVFPALRRADVLQLSTGVKAVPLRRTVVLFANVLLPLNDDSVRAEVVPAVGIERAF